MFNDNWYLFLLIVLVLFTDENGIDQTEAFVLIGIVAGLLIGTNCATPNIDTDTDDIT